MTAQESRNRIEALRKEIHRHNHAYHTLGRPTITDAAFDLLFRELRDLEASWPEFSDPNSPTARVGSQVMSDFPKVQHKRKMLSLDNAYNVLDVDKHFEQADSGIVEPKIDGLSLALRYENGKLVQAVTRGDGSTGDDVTANARCIASIPMVLPHPYTVEIRGEACMTFSVFEMLNSWLVAENDEPFANPRNAASGTMKSKDSRVVSKRRLTFIAYNVADPISFMRDTDEFCKQKFDRTHDNVLKYLGKTGFMTVYNYPMAQVNCLRSFFCTNLKNKDEIKKALVWGEEMRQFAPFPVDGLVFKINDLAIQAELGDGTRSPKWAIAFKFPPERKATVLKSIEVSIGRHGTLTPVAILEPLQLSGTTVQRASLCNQDEIARLGVNVGDMVYVEKSAEIIPKVMALYLKGKEAGVWQMPATCPCCGTAVKKDEGMVAHYCPNKACRAQVIERLKHALGKSALDWDGMGEETVTALVEASLLDGVPQITHLSHLLAVPGNILADVLKPAALKKFLTERERVKTVALWRKIHALGIEGIGRSLAQDLCAKWYSVVEMLDHEDDVKTLLGDVAFNSFKAFLIGNEQEIADLERYGYVFEESQDKIGKLSGKVFCITGTMMSGTREYVSQLVESHGGMTKSSVSKKVDYLVSGPGGGANKATAATKHGTQIITEEQLYALMGEKMRVVEGTRAESDS
jgi:DNA ligase (NAD+)